ncbi:MAG: hypothetical protein WCJ30_09410 [Deltaproteobacteria bacterium]
MDTQSTSRIAAPGGFLNGAISELTWEMNWHVVDRSGNSSPGAFTVFQVVQDSSLGCHPHHARILYAGPPPIEAAGRSQIFEFGAVPPGPATIWPGLTFARASGATVQIGAAAAVTNIGANVARVGDDGSNHRGLVFEEPRTNLIAASRTMTGAGWFGGYLTTMSGGLAGPDTATVAVRSQVGIGGYSNWQYIGPLTAGSYVLSEWVQQGTAPSLFRLDSLGGTLGGVAVGTTTAAWQRVSVVNSYAANSSSWPIPVDDAFAGPPGAALDNVTDLYQFEAGSYPTEAILTTNAIATRAGETLAVSSGASVLDGGRLSLEFRLQPKGSRSAYPMWAESLWTVDGANWAAIDPASGVLYVYVSGYVNTAALSPALSWNALDTLEIYVATGGGLPTEVQYRVNGATGGTTRTATVTGSPLGALTVPGALQLLCYGGGYQFTSYVQHIVALGRTARPTWLN